MIVAVGNVGQGLTMLQTFNQVALTWDAVCTLGVIEIYLTHPGLSSQVTAISSLKKIIGVLFVANL